MQLVSNVPGLWMATTTRLVVFLSGRFILSLPFVDSTRECGLYLCVWTSTCFVFRKLRGGHVLAWYVLSLYQWWYFIRRWLWDHTWNEYGEKVPSLRSAKRGLTSFACSIQVMQYSVSLSWNYNRFSSLGSNDNNTLLAALNGRTQNSLPTTTYL